MIAGLKVGVVIPAYNEARSLERILPLIPADLCDVVVVVNDGSSDDTSSASRKLGGRGIMISSHMTTDEDRRKAEEDGIRTAPSLGDAVDILFGLTEKGSPA